MRKILFVFISLLISINSFAQAPPGYYSGTEGLSSLYLKNKLHQIISKNTISWNYGDLPAIFETTDRDYYYENDGSMLDLYSENPDGPDPYNYTYEDPSLIAGASEEGMGWNREHTFAQSFFFGNYPMHTDLHFVIPVDARVNQRRSNYPFAVVNSDPAFVSLNGSKVGLSATEGYTLTVFEPIDEFKGDLARMFLYIAVRYENMIPFFDTTNPRNPFEFREEIALKQWQIDLLVSWHLADPVSEREIDRNNAVYTIQGNRNPFIDHPEWVEAIWTPVEDDMAPEVPSYLEEEVAGAHFIQIKWAESFETGLLGYEVFMNDSLIGTTKNNFFACTELEPETSYQFKVRAYDANYNKSAFSIPISASTLAEDDFASDLFFSKFIIGTENNRAIEITNNTGYTVDLRLYTINTREYNEYSETLYWGSNPFRLSGYLPHGKKVVIVHPDWDLACLELEDADFITGGPPTMFKGYHSIRLEKGDWGIDLFGNPYEVDTFAMNASAYRSPDVVAPVYFYKSTDWEWHPVNYCDSLGNPKDNGSDTSTSILPLEKQHLIIYPNPVNPGSRLYIKDLENTLIKQATLYNNMGREVWKQSYPFVNKTYLEVPDLPIGIYWLRLNKEVYQLSIISK